MIAQEIVFTRGFLKASRIRDYAQLKKIPCGNKKQARARVIYEFSGLSSDRGGVCSENLGGMDADAERTWMYLQRFSKQTPPQPYQ